MILVKKTKSNIAKATIFLIIYSNPLVFNSN